MHTRGLIVTGAIDCDSTIFLTHRELVGCEKPQVIGEPLAVLRSLILGQQVRRLTWLPCAPKCCNRRVPPGYVLKY